MEDLIKGELDWHNKVNTNFNELNTNKIGIQELIKVTGYGVIEGLTVSAQSTPDMTVNVAAGKVDMLSGIELAPTGNNNLAVTTANSTDARIDIVYINQDGSVGYTAGAPSSTPTVPDTPQGAFLLVQINVGAGVTAITNDNLVDKRKMKFTVDDVAGSGRTTETVKKNADDIKNLSTQMADITNELDTTEHVAKDGTLQTGLNADKLDGYDASSFALATQGNWITPTLLNGWVNYGVGFANAGYFKDSLGFIHIKAFLKGGVTTSGTNLFVLPVGYRPSETHRIIANCTSIDVETYACCNVDAYGNVSVLNCPNNQWLTFDFMFKAEQ